MKEIRTTIKDGAVLIQGAYIFKRSKDIVLIQVSTESKYPVVGAFTGGDGEDPGLYLEAGKDTLRLGKSTQDTLVEFRGYKGWDIYSASSGKYSINVTLYRGL